MKHLIAAVLILLAASLYANQQYRQEIIENIINPCFTVALRINPSLARGSEGEDALVMMRINRASAVEEIIAAYEPTMPELEILMDKERIYEMGLGACVKGLLQNNETLSSVAPVPGLENTAITRPTPDMMKEYRSIVENSSPHIDRAGLSSYLVGGEQKIEIFLMVSKNVDRPMARNLGERALAILENKWPQFVPADYLIDVMWTGNYTSSQSIDAATIAQGQRARDESTITWTY